MPAPPPPLGPPPPPSPTPAARVIRSPSLLLRARIPEGADLLECEDWDTGAAVSLTLDPTKPALEQAQGLYRRSQKMRRAADALGPLMEETQQEIEYLEQARQ